MQRALLGLVNDPKHQVYQPAKEGPFRCDHCEYYVGPERCRKPEIVALRQGMVEPGACCDYFEKR